MLRYIYGEIKYGGNLYATNWKKLLFHPWQTAKDIGKAIRHPIETAKALGKEIKKHPIGMAVNIGLNWATGKGIGEGIEYLSSLRESTAAIAVQNIPDLSNSSNSSVLSIDVYNSNTMHNLPNTSVPLHNPEVGGISSAILPIVQYGSGCGCAGVCATATTATTVGQIGPYLFSHSGASGYQIHNDNTHTIKKKQCSDSGCNNIEQQQDKDTINLVGVYRSLAIKQNSEHEKMFCSSFAPYFNTKRSTDSFLASVHSISEELLENKQHGYKNFTNVSESTAAVTVISSQSAQKSCDKNGCKP